MENKMKWEKLFNVNRRKPSKKDSDTEDPRKEFERDHDRILFSTPVRRLAKKTQVFPLEEIDSVRTRLTHSLEVANLGRSIGTILAFENDIFPEDIHPKRNIPSLLAAIGLAHDLGNPPFGHQGENSIRTWFNDNKGFLKGKGMTKKLKEDFLNFEGNAQTFRLVTKLQLINDKCGLNLTYGTLAALMKYTVPSDMVKEGPYIPHKKPGYFQSEKDIVEEVWKRTGIPKYKRHPLTYIMEACDDIAYSILDAEDIVKKGIASYADIIAFLNQSMGKDKVIKSVVEQSEKQHRQFKEEDLSPHELNDVSMQMFRVFSISAVVREVTETFKNKKNIKNLLNGSFNGDLVSNSHGKLLVELLKKFDHKHGYTNKNVLEIELKGDKVIADLMSILWEAIVQRKDDKKLDSERSTKFNQYAYLKISENYRRVFEDSENIMPVRYKEAQLLTDMISGMSDTFALALHSELKSLNS